MPTDDEYFDEFQDFTGTYSEADYEFFMQLYEGAGLPDDLDTWFEFLNAFYPEDESGLHDKQFWDDLRASFYEMTGITDDNIDWDAFREWLEENTPT